ncbi:type III secretion system translocon subunit CopB2 [Chlamydia trachomatis]|uniref:type III secretion system translocon subunit CopB2 n=1 Tax=Chlamydia trachomatis TaxID=813 RepID=UPI002AD59B36|nr:type III secretion system translocon subunit CopB2 [Chlamydia trachomatis]
MSSWFAQATDVALSQTLDLPDASLAIQTEKFPYSCSISKESAPSCIQKIFAHLASQKESAPLSFSRLQPTTPKERILFFGSSPSSQLSSTVRTTTSSPWNLFSNSQTRNSTRKLSEKLHFSSELSARDSTKPSSSEPIKPSENLLHTPEHHKELFSSLKKDNLSPIMEEIDSFSAETESLEERLVTQKKEETVAQEQKHPLLRTSTPPSKASGESQDSSEHSSKEDPHSQQPSHKIQRRKERAKRVVPIIIPPTVGIFSLSYLLTKQGILADFSAYSAYKDNLETTQQELTMLHQERIEQVQKIVDKSKTTRFWDSLASIVATIIPWIEMGVAVTIIALGGGILSWCSLFAALIMIVISLLEAFDGWRAIAKHLPGNDLEKKMRYLGYVKLALTVFSCLLSLSALYVAKLGMSPLLEGVVKSIAPALSGMLGLTQGVALYLQSSSQKIRAYCTQIDARIELINWERDEYFLRAEQLLDSMQTSFEQLTETLQLQREIDQTFTDALR